MKARTSLLSPIVLLVTAVITAYSLPPASASFLQSIVPTNTRTRTGTSTPTRTTTGTRTPTRAPTRTPTLTATRRPGTIKCLPIIVRQHAPGSTPAAIFSDDFSTPLSGWSANNGGWSIENSYLGGTYTTGNAWFIKNVSASDFTYEGDVNIVSGDAVGLTFRASSDGRYSYAVMVDAVGGVFKIVKQPGNALLGSYPWSISHNRWYQLKVVVTGMRIEGYLDGTKRLTVFDTNFPSGRFGVVVFQATGAYDDLRAGALP